MNRYFILMADYQDWFTCEADDASHAVEQALDANPEDNVQQVLRGEVVKAGDPTAVDDSQDLK